MLDGGLDFIIVIYVTVPYPISPHTRAQPLQCVTGYDHTQLSSVILDCVILDGQK